MTTDPVVVKQSDKMTVPLLLGTCGEELLKIPPTTLNFSQIGYGCEEHVLTNVWPRSAHSEGPDDLCPSMCVTMA